MWSRRFQVYESQANTQNMLHYTNFCAVAAAAVFDAVLRYWSFYRSGCLGAYDIAFDIETKPKQQHIHHRLLLSQTVMCTHTHLYNTLIHILSENLGRRDG